LNCLKLSYNRQNGISPAGGEKRMAKKEEQKKVAKAAEPAKAAAKAPAKKKK